MHCKENENISQNCSQEQKSCSNSLWLYIFIIFRCSMLIIAILAIVNGNYLAVINGYDSFGNICGLKHNKPYKNISLSGMDTSTKPFVLFFGWEQISTVVRICIDECPTELIESELSLVEHWRLKNFKYCLYDFDMSKLSNLFEYLNYKSSIGPCPSRSIYPSSIIKHRCIPMDFKDYVEELYSHLNNVFDTICLVFANIYLTWEYTVLVSGSALMLSTIVSIIIFFQVKLALWIIVIVAAIAQGGLYATLRHASNNIPVTNEDSIIYFLLNEYHVNNSVLYTLADLSLKLTILLAVVCLLIAMFVRKATVFFDEATNCLKNIPSLLQILLITLILLFGYIWVWTYVMLCMITASKPEISAFGRFPEKDLRARPFDERYILTEKVDYVEAESIRKLVRVYIFGLLWTIKFLFAFEEFCLKAAVGVWYFKGKENVKLQNIVKMLLRYHLGSVVKGTILTSLLIVPRISLFILNALFNKVTFKYLKRLKEQLNIIEKKLDKWNDNSYEFVGLEIKYERSETSFDASHQKIHINAAKCILFLAKLIVVNVTCIIGVLLLKDHGDIYFYMAPIIFNTIIDYLIAHIVFALFEKVMTSILICVAKDKELNNAGGRWEQSKFKELFKKCHGVQESLFIKVTSKQGNQ